MLNTEQKRIGTVIIALVIGTLLGYVIAGKAARIDERRMGMRDTREGEIAHTSSMHDSMEGMMSGIAGKEGDEFDRAFLEGMIVHHEGAVEMANAALLNAKHQEIKDLAPRIISAQTSEITQMRNWLTAWYSE